MNYSVKTFSTNIQFFVFYVTSFTLFTLNFTSKVSKCLESALHSVFELCYKEREQLGSDDNLHSSQYKQFYNPKANVKNESSFV